MKKASELDRSEIQKKSLIEFYESTNGPEWTQNANWLSPRPVHTWWGVTADKKGNILRLDLNKNNLSGCIPASIGELKELWDFRISENNIGGPLPESISELTKLKYFIANGNKLVGELPLQIGRLTNLSILRLQDQFISGNIPDSIEKCVELEELDLFHNYDISSRNLPENMHTLPRLKYFRVSDNNHIHPDMQRKLQRCLVDGIFWNDS